MNDSPTHAITTGIIVIVLAVALFAVICICRRLYLNRPVIGVIIDKKFIPEHLTNSVQNVLIGNTLHPQVMVENVPDTWQISVRPEGGGSVVTYDLTRERWGQITVGDRWPRAENTQTPTSQKEP